MEAGEAHTCQVEEEEHSCQVPVAAGLARQRKVEQIHPEVEAEERHKHLEHSTHAGPSELKAVAEEA